MNSNQTSASTSHDEAATITLFAPYHLTKRPHYNSRFY